MSPAAPRRPFDLPILLVVALALAGVVGSVMHFSAPVAPARVQVLNDVIAGRSIAYTPYPIGYYEFAGHAQRWSPKHGLVVAQGGLYIWAVLLSWCILRESGARGSAPLVGALLVAFYPNMLLTITRFQDTFLSCFFMILFAWLVVRLKRQGLSPLNALLAGALFGCMLLVRSNTLTLAPIALWAAFHRRSIAARQIVLAGASAAVAVAILAAVLIPVKGRLTVFDRYYGAYTFANGTHEHALEGVLHDYNGEMTMARSFQEQGLPFQGLERSDDALATEYLDAGRRFIMAHPFRYMALEGVKALNFFRPDFRNTGRSAIPSAAGFLIQTAIACIFFFWCYLRWRCRKTLSVSDGLMLIPTLVLYFLPFLLTNTDPRYRVPVDSLLILDSVLCWQRLFPESRTA